jgi:medium-chain acyl-[acyl-carrier-protein] hydrolase
MKALHQETYKIRANETGPSLKITLLAVAGYLQEAAWMHSMTLKLSVYELLKKGLTWILTRLIIQMDGLPKHNEIISVETWPSGYDRHHIFRDYRLLDSNGSLIGHARSIWSILDLKTRQIVPPPPFITDLTLQQSVPKIHFDESKIPVADAYANAKTFTANWFDIDINHHVNHISYIRWALESAPAEILLVNEAVSIDIVFRAESLYGDDVISYSHRINGQVPALLHKLVHKNSGKELALAKTVWMCMNQQVPGPGDRASSDEC